MTLEQKIQAIREKCIEANPEITEMRCECCMFNWGEYVNGCPKCWRSELSREENRRLFPNRSVRPVCRPIRLADVLLTCALGRQTGGAHYYEKSVIPVVDMWNLREDDLTKQSPECVELVHQLLKP
jgi:hypothetical protein